LPLTVEGRIRAFVAAQIQFSFGHEYAHHLRGHTGGERIAVAVAGGADSRFFNHSLEFDADFWALRNIQHAATVHKNVSEGAVHAFVSLHLYKELLDLRNQAVPISNSHPAPTIRLQEFLERIGVRGQLQPFANRLLSEAANLIGRFPEFLLYQRPDVLDFYGSVYLRSYTVKQLTDRIDF
jgi:hypothetical protein